MLWAFCFILTSWTLFQRLDDQRVAAHVPRLVSVSFRTSSVCRPYSLNQSRSSRETVILAVRIVQGADRRRFYPTSAVMINKFGLAFSFDSRLLEEMAVWTCQHCVLLPWQLFCYKLFLVAELEWETSRWCLTFPSLIKIETVWVFFGIFWKDVKYSINPEWQKCFAVIVSCIYSSKRKKETVKQLYWFPNCLWEAPPFTS